MDTRRRSWVHVQSESQERGWDGAELGWAGREGGDLRSQETQCHASAMVWALE